MQFQRVRTKKQRRQVDASAYVGRVEARRRKGIMRHLLAKHRGLCALCGEPVSLRLGDAHYATIDHVIPMSKGGQDRPDNYQLACAACNHAKGDSHG